MTETRRIKRYLQINPVGSFQRGFSLSIPSPDLANLPKEQKENKTRTDRNVAKNARFIANRLTGVNHYAIKGTEAERSVNFSGTNSTRRENHSFRRKGVERLLASCIV